MIRVRPARACEADRLTALCIRSKAHWGYDAEFMRQASAALTVAAATVEQGRTLVAEDRHGALIGVASVAALQIEGKFDLSLLFVEPSAIGTGVGRQLFEATIRLVESEGGTALSILADPFAVGFYQRMGAVKIGEAPSDAIPGRYLPLFEYTIASAASR
jgi:GNAT superfamily N-acetyltransferase